MRAPVVIAIVCGLAACKQGDQPAATGAGSAGSGAVKVAAPPAGVDVVASAEAAEATLQLRRAEKHLKTAVAERGGFPKAAAPLTPATPCCEGADRRCPLDAAVWQAPPWNALGLSFDGPHRFQYSYVSDGVSATVVAHGDLDCDGTTVDYTLVGRSADGAPTFTLAQPPNAD